MELSVRKLANWVDAFTQLDTLIGSPAIFRLWSGIFVVSAALERKCWTNIGKGPLYPHMYVSLVGPPGVGKTIVTSAAWDFLAALNPNHDNNGFHLGASSLTAASLIDELNAANRSIVFNDMTSVSFNSLTLVSNELGVLVPDYDPSFMSKLTDLYDNKPYSEKRRGNNLSIQIKHPQLALLSATTPAYLTSMLPQGAWEQGFLSRMMLVFSSEVTKTALFAAQPLNSSADKFLTDDLLKIAELHGPIAFSDEAATALNNWHMAGGPPIPEHPKLVNYLTRRTAHLTKLCMVAAISTHDERVITLDDFNLAMDWFLETELLLPDIFKAMVVGGDAQVMDECWHYFALTYAKEDHAISEHRIVEFLAARLPTYSVSTMFEVMLRAKLFEDVTMQTKGPGKWYKPKPRKRGV